MNKRATYYIFQVSHRINILHTNQILVNLRHNFYDIETLRASERFFCPAPPQRAPPNKIYLSVVITFSCTVVYIGATSVKYLWGGYNGFSNISTQGNYTLLKYLEGLSPPGPPLIAPMIVHISIPNKHTRAT